MTKQYSYMVWNGERVTSSDDKPDMEEVGFAEFTERVVSFNQKPCFHALENKEQGNTAVKH